MHQTRPTSFIELGAISLTYLLTCFYLASTRNIILPKKLATITRFHDKSKIQRKSSKLINAVYEPFGTSANHLARAEYQGCCSWVADSHDHCSKPFGIVFGISRMQSNLLQVEFAAQVNSTYDISTQQHKSTRITFTRNDHGQEN